MRRTVKINPARLARVLAPAETATQRDARKATQRQWTGDSLLDIDDRCERIRERIRNEARKG